MAVYFWIVLLLGFCLLIIWQDFKYRRTSNQTLLIAAGMQAIALIMSSTLYKELQTPFIVNDPLNALIGLVAGLVLFFPLWRYRAMGAGDVKFIATLGFCVGLAGLLPALLIGSVLAGVHAVAAVWLQGWSGARGMWRLAPDVRRGIPYAAYIACGVLANMLWFAFTSQMWLAILLGA